ncbi:hypothetical protein FKM82_025527 [Ascaphus truei]
MNCGIRGSKKTGQTVPVSRIGLRLKWIPVAGTAGRVVGVTSRGQRQAADCIVRSQNQNTPSGSSHGQGRVIINGSGTC